MSSESLRLEVPGILVSDCVVRRPEGEPRELILLLHGFQQTGSHVFRKFESALPANALVIAPNAPYPLPSKRPDGSYRVGCSWYFYDGSRDEYYVDMKPALVFLEALVRQVGAAALPKRIVGFSQGGYLAPFAGCRLGGVKQVVGVAAEFLGDELRESGAPWPPSFRMDAIHGAADDVVSAASARRGFDQVRAQGARGEFFLLEGVDHRIVTEMVAALRGVLAQAADE